MPIYIVGEQLLSHLQELYYKKILLQGFFCLSFCLPNTFSGLFQKALPPILTPRQISLSFSSLPKHWIFIPSASKTQSKKLQQLKSKQVYTAWSRRKIRILQLHVVWVHCTSRFHITMQVPTSSLSTRFSNCRKESKQSLQSNKISHETPEVNIILNVIVKILLQM